MKNQHHDFLNLGDLVTLLLVFMYCATIGMAQSVNDEFLNAHNSERETLGIPLLVWDDTLATYANEYATSEDTPQGGCSGALVHSGGPYGENLYWYWTSDGTLATPSQAVSAWISENIYYDYQTNTCATGEVCGHYTQVVWAGTSRVGCVAHACTSNPGATYTICSYDPAGNVVGEFPY